MAERRHRAGTAGRAAGGQRRGQEAVSRTDDAGAGHARILAVIRAIPRGQVMGYGEVAAKAGLPGRARLVAKLLGANEDRSLPWHRVLRSDGRIALPEGSAGWREQGQRLRAEGVQVENGRVRRERPARDLDAEIWAPR
ncbi:MULTISPECIES: MGMT family protein [Stenotrophomonas]|uniref:MGMT family protein n=1 Tax=Stenotrophomonas nitritireducens TaxID=83617 RepID=UPI0009EC6987|nr:MGMT family protein [Stenotrophomonas nitritireducens]